uniref:FBD domain-containing protein n=1 Tax=Quercus lobata TaxID=97700 RepID=A0A7N2LCL0_QUELO
MIRHDNLSAFNQLVRDYDVVNHWKSKEIYFKSLLLQLKPVKILCFAKTFHKKESILVVTFLLKNAKVLEKMFLDRCYDEVNHWKSKEIYFKSLL